MNIEQFIDNFPIALDTKASVDVRYYAHKTFIVTMKFNKLVSCVEKTAMSCIF